MWCKEQMKKKTAVKKKVEEKTKKKLWKEGIKKKLYIQKLFAKKR